tara:strand:+ start:1028 stop:1255 length:228 start_codon:yes stop_codon:yes gene_type:complete
MKFEHLIKVFLLPALIFSSIGFSKAEVKEVHKALFDTKQEAEKAAKNFNCTGAHKMGDKWMPCKNHLTNKKHHHH